MLRILIILIPLLVLCGCVNPPEPDYSAEARIDTAGLARHIKVLSSDEFEGRAPSSPGEEKTTAYLAGQFKALGVEPGAGDSYFQEVPLVSITAASDMSLEVASDNESKTFSYGDEFVAFTPLLEESVEIAKSEIIFVGYGINAPEYDWNDYEGLDAKGKTVLIVVNDPGYATKDESLFTGVAMTYYGRWTYKFEEAGRQGAAAAIIIHQTGPAGYGWEVIQSSNTGTQFYQAGGDLSNKCKVHGWISEETAREWFAMAGLDMEQELAQAATRGFKSRHLGLQMSVSLQNTIERSTSRNVIAAIKGKSRPDECVIYTAHWDHLGKDETLQGDQIYNGAFDNATGVAGLLELAEAFMAAGRPDRTVVFKPVTAEEQGLLGSAYYAESPVYPLEKTVAAINIDGLNIYGRMKDIIVIGYGNSDLDDYIAEAAQRQGRVVKPDPQPEKGFYYRSDHFSFAKKGVPSLYTDNGIDHVEKGEEWTISQMNAYAAEKYHNPADEYDPSWDLTGGVDDLRLFFRIGLKLANSEEWPEWKDGVSFKAIREKSRGLRAQNP